MVSSACILHLHCLEMHRLEMHCLKILLCNRPRAGHILGICPWGRHQEHRLGETDSMGGRSFDRELTDTTSNPLVQGERPTDGPVDAAEEKLADIKAAVLAKLALTVGKDAGSATDRDWFMAAALALRDRIMHRWLGAERTSYAQGRKRVYYLSLEFLVGRLFWDVLCNLGLAETFRAAL